MTVIYLYTRAACELCDKALELYRQLCAVDGELATRYSIEKVDISLDAQLTDQYGLSIPVLERADTGEKLFWPFPPSRLREFMKD